MKTLTLIGKRWFNRRCGTTYHSVEIIVDGNHVHYIPLAHGYDQQWEYNGMLWLEANGYLPGRKKKSGTPGEAIWRYCERFGIVYTYSVTDVQRKKDL